MILLCFIAGCLLLIVGYLAGRNDSFFKSWNDFFFNHSFLFRLIVSLILLLVLTFSALYFQKNYSQTFTLLDASKYFISGLVAIGLLYTILAFEFNVKKYREDRRLQKTLTTYSAISDWHKTPLTDYSKLIREFENSPNFELLKGDIEDFESFLNQTEQSDLKKAFVSLFNYFEIISGALAENAMDEEFIKRFFKTIFVLYYDYYIKYIGFRRTTEDSLSLWEDYTNLVEKWKKT